MPRDLVADHGHDRNNDSKPLDTMASSLMEERFRRIKDVRPFPLLLSSADLDDCDWLEHAAFEPHEAASREKVRLCIACLFIYIPVHLSRWRFI
jgi:hypothetical protein